MAAYVWPVAGQKPKSGITNPFGAGQVRAAGFRGTLPARNNGLDIGAAAGTPVLAPVAGRVLAAGWSDAGYGNTVLLEGAGGERFRLSHLREAPGVRAGQTVAAGAVLGRVGATGNATGAHLDLEYMPAGGAFADPLGLDFGGPPPGPPGGPPDMPNDDRDRDQPTSGVLEEYRKQRAALVAEQERLTTLYGIAAGQAQGPVRAGEDVLTPQEVQADLQQVETRLAALDTSIARETDRLTRAAATAAGPTRSAAQEDADRAQAELYRAQAARAGRPDDSVAVAEIGAATSRANAATAAGASMYNADLDAMLALANQQRQQAQAAALLQWEREKYAAQQQWAQTVHEWNVRVEEGKATREDARDALTAAYRQHQMDLENRKFTLDQERAGYEQLRLGLEALKAEREAAQFAQEQTRAVAADRSAQAGLQVDPVTGQLVMDNGSPLETEQALGRRLTREEAGRANRVREQQQQDTNAISLQGADETARNNIERNIVDVENARTNAQNAGTEATRYLGGVPSQINALAALGPLGGRDAMRASAQRLAFDPSALSAALGAWDTHQARIADLRAQQQPVRRASLTPLAPAPLQTGFRAPSLAAFGPPAAPAAPAPMSGSGGFTAPVAPVPVPPQFTFDQIANRGV